MTPRFLAFIPFLWEWEGTEFEDDKDDSGGATKFGIDQRSHPNENIRELTAQRAMEIYWQEWLACGADAMPSPLAECYFDTVVNCGKFQADKFMVDSNPCGLAERLLMRREHFYARLALQHPKMQKFLRGWLNRVKALAKRFELELEPY